MAKPKPAKTVSGNGKAPVALSPFDVLTLPEVAAYLRLPEDAVRAEAESGRLIGQHVRGEWRFVRTAVAAWLQTPRTVPAIAGPIAPETAEEQEAFLANIRAHRDELDRATGSGKYATE